MGFGNISAQTLRPGKTIEVVLNQLTNHLGDHPVLIIEHLGETNAAFWNEVILDAGKSVHAAAATAIMSKEEIAKNRIENRETLAKHSVRGHRGFFHDLPDQPGVEDPSRPAGADDTRDLVFALPDDVIQSILAIAKNEQNFREGRRGPAVPARDLAGK